MSGKRTSAETGAGKTEPTQRVQRKPGGLSVNRPGDRFEHEAERAAEAVVRGGARPSFSLTALPVVQRDEKPKTDAEKALDAAEKIGEAFLQTPLGKQLIDDLKADPLVTGAKELGEKFIATWPGKIITGAAAIGAVSALAAAGKPLPAQLPEIPLTFITPGLAVKITYEGPVNSPTSASISFSYAEQGTKQNKPKQTEQERFRAETARMAAEQERFREGLKTDAQRAQEAAEGRAALAGVTGRSPIDIDAIIARSKQLQQPQNGVQLNFPRQQFGFRPPALLGDELKLKPIDPLLLGPAAEEQKKKDDKLGVQRAASGEAPASAPPSVDAALSAAGQPLDAATRSFMEARFGVGFGQVRVHTDARAAGSAHDVSAYAYTVGQDIVFGSGQYAPETPAGRRLLAHELAHVVQQGGHRAAAPGGQGALDMAPGLWQPPALTPLEQERLQRQPTSLGAYPEAERRRVRVSDIAIGPPPGLADLFTAPQGSTTGNPGASFAVTGTVVFGTGVPAAPPLLRRGLESVGGWLAHHTNALPLNSTITLTLNLTPFGGADSRFRFSYLEHTENRATANVMVIELLGAAVAAPTAVALPTTGAFIVRGRTFRLGSGWDDTRFALLRQGLELSPDAVLDALAGLNFRRTPASGGNEAGRYDGEHDVIEIDANAFHDSPTTATAARVGTSDPAVRVIAHEIGHAADLRRLHQAWTTFDTGGQTAAGRRTLLSQRSASGSRWVDPGSGNYTMGMAPRETRGQEFREAALADGAVVSRAGALSGGVTTYADTDWQEAFAEAYSLYVTDPDLLLQLRPNLSRYFTRRFPQPAPAAPAAAGGGTAP